IMDWTEFTWRVVIGDLDSSSKLSEITDLATIHARFGRSGWRVQDLFALGSVGLRDHLPGVVVGSLLHLFQDSFSKGHVERASEVLGQTCDLGGNIYQAPGEIMEFHSYPDQNHDKHSASDSAGAFSEHLMLDADVVAIGRPLVAAFR